MVYHIVADIFAIDAIDSRLEMAKAQGWEVIDFAKEDPVQTVRELTGGIGPDYVIEAVGIDANTSEGVQQQRG